MTRFTKANMAKAAYKSICKDMVKSIAKVGSILLNVDIYRGQRGYILRMKD